MIGSIFGVSMDYLLKDSVEPINNIEAGYYVSKEMAEGYLISSHKIAKYISGRFFLIILSFLLYFIFKHDPTLYTIFIMIPAALGVGLIVSTSFLEEQYKVLKQEPLILDETYLEELIDRYEKSKKKHTAFIVGGVFSMALGSIPFLINKRILYLGTIEHFFPASVVFIAIGVYIITRTSTVLEAYKLLAKNKEYTNKLSFKIRRKVKSKIDEF